MRVGKQTGNIVYAAFCDTGHLIKRSSTLSLRSHGLVCAYFRQFFQEWTRAASGQIDLNNRMPNEKTARSRGAWSGRGAELARHQHSFRSRKERSPPETQGAPDNYCAVDGELCG